MKKTLLMSLMALLVLGVTTPVFAEETLEEMDRRCHEYAVEDGISADEMDDYIKECIDGIMQENNDSSASEPEVEPGQEENKD